MRPRGSGGVGGWGGGGGGGAEIGTIREAVTPARATPEVTTDEQIKEAGEKASGSSGESGRMRNRDSRCRDKVDR